MVPVAIADRQRGAEAIGDCTYRVAPERIVAWDYGSLREVPTGTANPRVRRLASLSVAGGSDGGAPVPIAESQKRRFDRSRVMILASRSPRERPSRYRCGSFIITAASMRRPRLRPGRCAMWLLHRRCALLLGGEGRDRCGPAPGAWTLPAPVRGIPPPAVLARMAWRYYLQPQFAAVELSHIRPMGAANALLRPVAGGIPRDHSPGGDGMSGAVITALTRPPTQPDP